MKNTNDSLERLSPAAGSVIDLLKRMRVHREMMAPHQKTRLQGAMFIEAIKMIEHLAQALDCIADYGGKTVETECGEMTCSGSWCAEQARCAISQNAKLSDSASTTQDSNRIQKI